MRQPSFCISPCFSTPLVARLCLVTSQTGGSASYVQAGGVRGINRSRDVPLGRLYGWRLYGCNPVGRPYCNCVVTASMRSTRSVNVCRLDSICPTDRRGRKRAPAMGFLSSGSEAERISRAFIATASSRTQYARPDPQTPVRSGPSTRSGRRRRFPARSAGPAASTRRIR